MNVMHKLVVRVGKRISDISCVLVNAESKAPVVGVHGMGGRVLYFARAEGGIEG